MSYLGFPFHDVHEVFIQRYRSVSKGDEMFQEFLRRVRREQNMAKKHPYAPRYPEQIFNDMEREYFEV
jgi:hypothetical protein